MSYFHRLQRNKVYLTHGRWKDKVSRNLFTEDFTKYKRNLITLNPKHKLHKTKKKKKKQSERLKMLKRGLQKGKKLWRSGSSMLMRSLHRWVLWRRRRSQVWCYSAGKLERENQNTSGAQHSYWEESKHTLTQAWHRHTGSTTASYCGKIGFKCESILTSVFFYSLFWMWNDHKTHIM